MPYLENINDSGNEGNSPDPSADSFVPTTMTGAVRASLVLNLLTQSVSYTSPINRSGQVKLPFTKSKAGIPLSFQLLTL